MIHPERAANAQSWKPGRPTSRTRLATVLTALGVTTAAATLVGPAAPAAAQGESCPNAELRQGVASHLPDCRAYEQVSPAEKNGHDIGASRSESERTLWGGPSTAAGDSVAFWSSGSFADAQNGFGGTNMYFASRTGEAWETKSLLPRSPGGLPNIRIRRFTPDMSESIIQSSAALTPDSGDDGSFYHRDNLTETTTFVAPMSTLSQPANVSADLGHIAFSTVGVITDLNPPAPDQPTGPNDRKIYEHTGGDTRLVTRQPGTNAAFPTAAHLGHPGGDPGLRSADNGSTQGAISEDGEHIFFTTPQLGDAVKIYRRSHGTTTTLVSPSKRTPVDSEAAKYFQLATADGNRVFFITRERLTDDANTPGTSSRGDLYRYDVAADELVDLSAQTAGDSDADVRGVLGTSASGDRVYFAARGEVVPSEGDPAATKLYLWEDDGAGAATVRFIANLDPTEPGGKLGDDSNWQWDGDRTAQVTADGDHLLFHSFANVTGFDPAGTAQIYLYDAEADGGNGDLVCVSCPDHVPSGTAASPEEPSPLAVHLFRRMSEDGERVLFTSPDSLADRDSNGKLDAYLWQATSEQGEALTGETHLISSGRSGFDSYAYGGSADGDDYFFRTREQLVPHDGDTLVDLYTAPVNGGLESQHDDATPECEGDGCQGELSDVPPATAPGSSGFVGAGNPSAGEEPGARSCTRVERRADRSTRKAKQAQQRLKRVRRKARRAEGKRERRLERKLERQKTKAKKAKRKAKRLKRRARQCKRGGE